jgi:hypothetical protein
MTEHDYEATVETEHGTFTFSGDDARTVSAQAARMPVLMHSRQVQDRIDLSLPISRYMEEIAQQEEKLKNKAKKSGYTRRHERD